jgi:hypothetical protein
MLRRTLPAILLSGLAGAILMYVLDPHLGNRRRKMAIQKLIGTYHRSTHQLAHIGRTSSARLYGLSQRLTHLRPGEKDTPNDETLTQRVRSQLLRDPAMHRHHLNINAEHGIIVLRGAVDHPEQISKLEKEARHIPGVQGIHNLLHLSGTPAPMSH